VTGFAPLFEMLADRVEAMLADKPVLNMSKGAMTPTPSATNSPQLRCGCPLSTWPSSFTRHDMPEVTEKTAGEVWNVSSLSKIGRYIQSANSTSMSSTTGVPPSARAHTCSLDPRKG
jgi:hypothetical protein